MSGGVKSGLLFGLVSFIVIGGLTIIPTLGQLCCGPLGALLLGGAAGYVGVRWSGELAGMGQGVLAGALAGVGVLAGTVLGFVLYIALVRSWPEARQMLDEAVRQQQGAEALTPQDVDTLLNIVAPVLGFCFGLLWLLFSLGAGALGGWLAVQQRRGEQPPAQPPIAMPPPA
ncbi:MAG: hypothetical protein RLZZ387_3684 [Chloroflexota bacterium]|jgi:hypothetical protein